MTNNQLIAVFGVMAAFLGLQTTVILWAINSRLVDIMDKITDLRQTMNDRFVEVDRRLAEIEKAMPRKLTVP